MILLFKSDAATTETVGKWSIRANLRKKGYNSGMKNEAGVLKAALKFTNIRGHLVELFSTDCKTK